MIKTAEEYLEDAYSVGGHGADLQFEVTLNPSIDRICSAIKGAMKDTVLLCAEIATAELERETFPDGTETANLEDAYPVVNKQSILNLLNEIK